MSEPRLKPGQYDSAAWSGKSRVLGSGSALLLPCSVTLDSLSLPGPWQSLGPEGAVHRGMQSEPPVQNPFSSVAAEGGK